MKISKKQLFNTNEWLVQTIIDRDNSVLHRSILDNESILFPFGSKSSQRDWDERLWQYNLRLVLPEVSFLKESIKSLLLYINDKREFEVSFWVNYWRKGETIAPHVHNGLWGGYYVVKDTKTITTIVDDGLSPTDSIIIENRDGLLTMLPSTYYHWGSPNEEEEARTGIGFNLHLKGTKGPIAQEPL